MEKPYTITGTRCSLLTVSQFCGVAAELSEQHGAGRAAAMSSAQHALLAQAPDAPEKFARLTEEEKDEIANWQPPKTCHPTPGVELDYESATKETPVGLDAEGEYVEPGGEALTAGTPDFYWIREVNGLRVAYIGDMKKTRWTTLDGPKSLQLLAYGWAVAKKHGCDAFCCGLWFLEEGAWSWGEIIDMNDWDSLDTWNAIRFAASNKGEAATGAHCRDCYGRMHCKEYLLPLALSDTQLRAFTHAEALTEETVTMAVLYAQTAEDLAAAVKDNAKEWLRRNPDAVVRDARAGKVWKPVDMPGRQSIPSIPALLQAFPGAEKFVKQGSNYQQRRWTKG